MEMELKKMLFAEAMNQFKDHLIVRDKSKETIRGYLQLLNRFNMYMEEMLNGEVYLDEVELMCLAIGN